MFLKDQPLATGACSVFPYSEGLKELLTVEARYNDEILPLYRELDIEGGKYLLVPRGLAPVGPQDYRTEGADVSFTSVFQPRDSEQERFIAESVALLQAGDNFIARAPTGFGKTAVSMDIIAQLGKKTLIVVTKEDIKDQWVKAASDFLNLSSQDIGLIQADECDVAGKKLVIAMIHSMGKLERYPKEVWQDFGLVIWDEVHRIGAEMFSNSGWVVPAKRRFGLSATPHRKDGKDILLEAHIGPVKVTTDRLWLTPKVIVKKSKFKLPRVPKNGAWVPLPHEAGKCMHVFKLLAQDFSRNCLILDFVLEAYKKGRRTIIFSDLREAHLVVLHDLLRTNGIFIGDIGYYVGGMTEKQREVASKKKVILATYKMASEATNIPWLDTAVYATPRADVEQITGRILREWAAKKEPVVFDIVDEDSDIFRAFFRARLKFYHKINASIIGVD